MTERGAGSTGEDGREPVALSAELAVAEGVDAGVESDESSGGHSGLDHRGSEAIDRQLPASHHAVLALSQHPESNSGRLRSYIDHG